MTAPVLPAPHEFVSLSRAARAYPKRDSYVRRRLRELGLVNADGLVLWGQVVQAMSARGSACAVVPQLAIARSTDGDAEQDMGAKGWPRLITVDVVDGTQVRAQAMKSRGQKGDGRVYWKVRRYPGQAGLSVKAFTASGSGWATRPEIGNALLADGLNPLDDASSWPPVPVNLEDMFARHAAGLPPLRPEAKPAPQSAPDPRQMVLL